jgi:chitodextrinase
VDLSWNASSDNVGVAGYQVFRNGSVLASVPGTLLSYADTGVNPVTTFTYFVKAYDAAGNYSNPGNTIQVTTPAPPASGACPGPATNAFTGCYYNNIDLSGNPVLNRTDSQINFDWASGSPDPSVAPGDFSVRWQGNFSFSQGTYTFNVVTSDGMRLYIDGNSVLDRWRDQPPYMYRIELTLSAGTHLLTVEYYDHTRSSTAHLSWQNNAPQAAPVISSFTATPSIVTAGASATLSWSVSGASTVSIDHGVGDVSTATSKSLSPAQTTTYTLTAINSAGSATAQATLTVNSIIDTQPPTAPTIVSAVARSAKEVDLAWNASTDNVGVAGYEIFRNGTAMTSVSGSSLSYADQTVSAGSVYTYIVKAYDAAGNYSAASNSAEVSTASASDSGTCPGPAANAFTGCYYNNIDLSGNPVLSRTDSQINFDWASGPPDPSVAPVDFSVRWQGNFSFGQGTYTFNVVTSDGMRLYIDGNPVLDRWRDQSPYMYQIQLTLSAGTHLITVEYYDHTRSSTAHLSWQ